MRCTRCGREAAEADKFCAECGMFLRDAFTEERILMACTYERQGKHREARRELERLVEGGEPNALANHLLGSRYFHQGTIDLAIERYEAALAEAPEFVLCVYDLGVAWYHRGNMLRAIDAFRRCLAIDPNYNAAHYRLGISLFHAGDLDGALEHFEKCSSLTPEYLMARYHVGIIHERRGDAPAAKREFQRSVDEAVGEVSSYFHLAALLREEGKIEEADALLKQAHQFGDARTG